MCAVSFLGKKSRFQPQGRSGRFKLQSALFAGLFGAFVFFSPAVAWGQGVTITYDGTDPSLLGDPVYYFPGSNNASNFTPQVGALFPKTSSSNNTIYFTNGNIYVLNPVSGRTGPAGNVYGGIGDKVIVEFNEVYISGGTVYDVFGGLGAGVNVNYNIVDIEDATVRNAVYGGRIILGSSVTANENSVSIGSGALIYGNVYGVYSVVSGTFNDNSIDIAGGEIRGSIISGAYAFISGVTVSGNAVTIDGGIIVNADIYGGRGQSGAGSPSVITGNTVTIKDGQINQGRPGKGIYGGQNISGNGARVENNEVAITGGNVVADIYGGYNGGNGSTRFNIVSISGSSSVQGNIYGGYSSSGTATYNTVTVGGSATLLNASLFGGQVGSGGGDAFTGNTLNKNSAAIADVARNFEFVNFGYSGAANIGTLYTTPTGSTRLGVTLDTHAYNIDFAGIIAGTGSLTKNGTGTLTLTGGNTYTGGTTVSGGILQIGNGGTTGSILGNINITNNAEVVFNRSDDILFSGVISGGGDLSKRGAGTLILTNNNSIITGAGTTVNVWDGTLQLGNGGTTGNISTSAFIVNSLIPGEAALAYKHSNNVTVTQQIVGNGKVIQRGTGMLTLQNTSNSFYGGTEIESGTLRIVDRSLNAAVSSSKAGYITFTGAGAAQITVDSVDWLTNTFRTQAGAGRNNRVDLTAAPVWDGTAFVAEIKSVNIASLGGAFYVADGTAMDVDVKDILVLEDNRAVGQWNDLYVEATGTFNLNLKSSPTSTIVNFASGVNGEGTLNISGDGTARFFTTPSNPTTFHMGTTNVAGNGQTILSLIRANGALPRVTFTNTGAFNLGNGNGSPLSAVLIGDGIVSANVINVNSGTLAPTTLLPAVGPGTLTLDAPTINLKDFALLYMGYGTQTALTPGSNGIPDSNNDLLNLKGTVNLESGIVHFVTADGVPFVQGPFLVIRSDSGFTGITDDIELNKRLKASLDGFAIDPVSGGPRGGGVSFHLGNDSDPYVGTTNVWFAHDLNSLTMDWTGGNTRAAPFNGSWVSGNFFYSLQTGAGGEHERQFLTGDKVYISGNNSFTIDLPAKTLASKIVVSGLVVGQDSNGNTYNSGNYTFSGQGGIRANENAAFGSYVGVSLFETGMLQKYGNSTLTFSNTGGNFFEKGIELYGGTIAFNRAEQLAVGSTGKITFQGNATLKSNANVTLGTSQDIAISGGASGTFDTNGYTAYIKGVVSGLGSLVKANAGKLVLEGVNTYSGDTTISAGTLEVTGSLGSGTYGGNITNIGTLIFDQGAAQTLNGAITGTGTLVKKGLGTTLTLSEASTAYAGRTEVREGVLEFTGVGDIGGTLALYNGVKVIAPSATSSSRLEVWGLNNDWVGNLDMAGRGMSFYLPDTMMPGNTMLTVSGTADINGSTVNMTVVGKNRLQLAVGEKYILIDDFGAPALNGTYDEMVGAKATQDPTVEYIFHVFIEPANQLIAQLDRVDVPDEAKTFPTGLLPGVLLVNRIVDLTAGEGMSAAIDVGKNYGHGIFGTLSAGKIRYHTGSHSHIDMTSVSLMTGYAWGMALAPGYLTFGVFFEYGDGSYDTYDLYKSGPVRGNGNIYHVGGGALSRLNFSDTGSGHFYAEAGARVGNIHNSFKSIDLLRDEFDNKQKVSYRASSAYYGMYTGGGYVWKVSDKASLDMYGKYFWMRQAKETVRLSSGQDVKFENVDSHRLRVGGRYTRAVSETVRPYIGAAVEREFDSKVRATTGGRAIDQPDIRGNTVMAEVGIVYKPTKYRHLTIETGLQGYTGKLEGVSGSLQVRYKF